MDIEKYKESMPRCKDCTGFGWGECKTAGENEVACKDFERKPKLTNADRIRQMTDEELADFFCRISQCCGNDTNCSMCPIYDGCAQNVMCVERWLKQEVSEDAGSKTD